VRVYSPALSVFGVTTAGDFYSALKTEDASNGFLNRFLILEEKNRGEERVPEGWSGDVPFPLMDRMRKTAAKYQSGKDQPAERPLKPAKMEWGRGDKELYRQFSKSIRSESDERMLELRIRAGRLSGHGHPPICFARESRSTWCPTDLTGFATRSSRSCRE